MEERDNKKEGRDIEACLKMADFRIENNGTLKELYQKLDKVLKKIREKS
jgi:dephospho-CoA kinase